MVPNIIDNMIEPEVNPPDQNIRAAIKGTSAISRRVPVKMSAYAALPDISNILAQRYLDQGQNPNPLLSSFGNVVFNKPYEYWMEGRR